MKHHDEDSENYRRQAARFLKTLDMGYEGNIKAHEDAIQDLFNS